ncbi:MAG: hypothetical protein V3S01_06890 [Dehalococcoidia bacterium]
MGFTNNKTTGVLYNRLAQRTMPGGSVDAQCVLRNGRVITDTREAVEILMAHIPAPGPTHPTYYLRDKSGARLFDVYGNRTPWHDKDLLGFIELLNTGKFPHSFAEYHISRFDRLTQRRDVGPYVLDDPMLLCIEHGSTNAGRHGFRKTVGY